MIQSILFGEIDIVNTVLFSYLMKYIVSYCPENLTEAQKNMIRENIIPCMTWDETSQYNCDSILEEFWHDQSIVEACEWCDYLEL